MARLNFRWRKNVSIPRVVGKITATLLALYVGGTIVTEVGKVMVNTTSPFYKGLTLIGWTIGNPSTNGTAGWYVQPTVCGGLSQTIDTNCINSTSGSGILAVVGIVGIASVVMEFVQVKMR